MSDRKKGSIGKIVLYAVMVLIPPFGILFIFGYLLYKFIRLLFPTDQSLGKFSLFVVSIVICILGFWGSLLPKGVSETFENMLFSPLEKIRMYKLIEDSPAAAFKEPKFIILGILNLCTCLLILFVIGFLINTIKKFYSRREPVTVDTAEEVIPKKEFYPYHKKAYFFSIAERKFFDVLSQAIEEQGVYIFSKVRLWDIVQINDSILKRQHFENRIKSKHVDFLICGDRYISPLLIIELDDRSHEENDDVVKRDRFVDKCLETANIDILHIPVKQYYDIEELKTLILPYLKPRYINHRNTSGIPEVLEEVSATSEIV